MINNGIPITGIVEKACEVSAAPFPLKASILGYLIIHETSTIPVNKQITTVSQNVPVIDTNACRLGFFVFAAEAINGALPIPDSFENKPLANPYLQHTDIVVPIKPPVTASG